MRLIAREHFAHERITQFFKLVQSLAQKGDLNGLPHFDLSPRRLEVLLQNLKQGRLASAIFTKHTVAIPRPDEPGYIA